MDSRFQLLLFLICVLTDLAAFAVIFAVSRGLAEGRAEVLVFRCGRAGR